MIEDHKRIETTASVAAAARGPETSPKAALRRWRNCNSQVTLSAPPPTGNAQVTATIEAVGGEKNTANNTLTFPVGTLNRGAVAARNGLPPAHLLRSVFEQASTGWVAETVPGS